MCTFHVRPLPLLDKPRHRQVAQRRAYHDCQGLFDIAMTVNVLVAMWTQAAAFVRNSLGGGLDESREFARPARSCMRPGCSCEAQ